VISYGVNSFTGSAAVSKNALLPRCLVTDGDAALILVSGERARGFPKERV